MKALLKMALLAGLGAAAWKGWQEYQVRNQLADEGEETARPAGFVRDAGVAGQHLSAADWDLIDEQLDESFPASDPPGNYRGLH